MEEIIIKRTHEKSLKFKGVLIARARSEFDTAHENYSGSTGRAYTYELYRTSGKSFVAVKEYRTMWQGDENRLDARYCKSTDEIYNFFANHEGKVNRFINRLFEYAEIEIYEEIE